MEDKGRTKGFLPKLFYNDYTQYLTVQLERGLSFNPYCFQNVCKHKRQTFKILQSKKLRAFSRQASGLTVNIPVLQGLLRVNRKAEKDA